MFDSRPKKLTKIIATISDRRCEEEFIRSLWVAGMDAVRLNTAHQDLEASAKIIRAVRNVSNRIPCLIDTKGPEVRTTCEARELLEGDTLTIGATGADITVSYEGFANDVPVGARVLFDDGLIELEVLNKKDGLLQAVVHNTGMLGHRRSVNVPGISLDLPALTDKDLGYIDFAIEHDIEFIAHSFVRSRDDLDQIQRRLDQKNSKVKLIAKIESQQGVTNLDEILDVAFGVMVARGDLGIELPAARVPGVQKQIIEACVKRCKPVITATQMLHTMIEQPRPTRAEVSDIATAVFDGTDALMLSGETAYGRYPLEAVKTMASIASTVEQERPVRRDLPTFDGKNKTRNYLARAAVLAGVELPIKGMVCDTDTGLTARVVSAYRSHLPVFAKSIHPRVVREMALSYGIHPSPMRAFNTSDELVTGMLASLLEEGVIAPDDQIIFLAESPGKSAGHNFIEINTARAALR